MDRLATDNMTSKGRNPLSLGIDPNQPLALPNGLDLTMGDSHSLDSDHGYFEHQYNHGGASLSRWQSQMTSKAKVNNEMTKYQMERQVKNGDNYQTFVSSLDRNIQEDQQRTGLNNERWQTQTQEVDHFNRVYHPTLANQLGSPPEVSGVERLSQGTRDRREHGKAKTPNTIHSGNPIDGGSTLGQNGLPLPPPKLNYPWASAQTPIQPLDMDTRCHIDRQFQTLSNPQMDQQIQTLQKRVPKHGTDLQPTHGQTPMDRQSYFHSADSHPYNPHADHLNDQLQQMSLSQPEHRNTIANQLQDMNTFHMLSNLPNQPSNNVLGFQRPASSNLKTDPHLDPNNNNFWSK